jgi:hypothetical protein
MQVGLDAIFPTKKDRRVSMESSTSFFDMDPSARALSMNREHSSNDSMNVRGSAYNARVTRAAMPFLRSLVIAGSARP